MAVQASPTQSGQPPDLSTDMAAALAGIAKIFQHQPHVYYANPALGTAEVTLLEIGALGGASSHRLDGVAINIAALGTGTTTIRFTVYVDINGVQVNLATVDRTSTGAFSLIEFLGAMLPANPYVKITAQRLTGTGTGGSVSATIEYSRAT